MKKKPEKNKMLDINGRTSDNSKNCRNNNTKKSYAYLYVYGSIDVQ